MASLSILNLTTTPQKVGETLTTASAPLRFTGATGSYRVYMVPGGDPAPVHGDPHEKLRVRAPDGDVDVLEILPASGYFLGDLYLASEKGEDAVTLLTGDAPA